jgi:hypothetical protein
MDDSGKAYTICNVALCKNRVRSWTAGCWLVFSGYRGLENHQLRLNRTRGNNYSNSCFAPVRY